MISTKNLVLLPDTEKLKAACKSMSVLDAILCQDWTYRYYSYNSEWSEDEEFCEMRNGEGQQLLILFKQEGVVINGFSADATAVDKNKLTAVLPDIFHEFIFGEPVHSAGTTFCIWKQGNEEWKSGFEPAEDDHSTELLTAFDGKPETYQQWATAYYQGSYVDSGIPLATVSGIFDQEPLTEEMVLSLVDVLEDWELLKEDLSEISYSHYLKH